LLDELVVIPARYRSTRLPGKPLVEIAGKPMLLWTYSRCREVFDGEQILVATDDDRIADLCRAQGIRYEMTSPDHPTGGDRVAEIASRIEARTYLNVQGDEPVCNPDDIRLLVDEARAHRDRIIIGYCHIDDEHEWRDPNCCKLIFNRFNEVLYIGRAPVPATKSGEFVVGYRQVCIHAYPRDALAAFASTGGRIPLEAIEDHEMLRFLDLGWKVHTIEMSKMSVSVDRPTDVPRAEAALRELGLV
jgi:3-deoxy-manno-octulosonate cytidylyltransferase (CMP-KDO synthetase)